MANSGQLWNHNLLLAYQNANALAIIQKKKTRKEIFKKHTRAFVAWSKIRVCVECVCDECL